jgi:hypothetical protein
MLRHVLVAAASLATLAPLMFGHLICLSISCLPLVCLHLAKMSRHLSKMPYNGRRQVHRRLSVILISNIMSTLLLFVCYFVGAIWKKVEQQWTCHIAVCGRGDSWQAVVEQSVGPSCPCLPRECPTLQFHVGARCQRMQESTNHRCISWHSCLVGDRVLHAGENFSRLASAFGPCQLGQMPPEKEPCVTNLLAFTVAIQAK